MAFQFQNPGPSRIDHVLHRPFGLVRIGPGEYVPTVIRSTLFVVAQ